MNPAQKQEYRSIVKAVKAGGDGADKALEDFKASLKSKFPMRRRKRSRLRRMPIDKRRQHLSPAPRLPRHLTI
jgi:hypothetical protein